MEIKSYIENNKKKFLDELFELIRIPSISAIKDYDKELRKAATFLKNQFDDLGLENCEICETEGYPIVYAEKIKDKNLPTVLVYGHYDVQPVDPIDLWDSKPFEPVIKKTKIQQYDLKNNLRRILIYPALILYFLYQSQKQSNQNMRLNPTLEPS